MTRVLYSPRHRYDIAAPVHACIVQYYRFRLLPQTRSLAAKARFLQVTRRYAYIIYYYYYAAIRALYALRLSNKRAYTITILNKIAQLLFIPKS